MKKIENVDNIIETDFLIVGTGIAGLYTALKLSNLGKVIILTKEQVENSNTQYAQGGIAAVLDKGDSWQLHMKDTLKAGAGLCNRKAVEVMVTEGPARVKELIRLGTNFDHIEGELDLTQEGAHSRRRILHARGDATGVEIRESLTRQVMDNENIILKENTFMVRLLAGKINYRKNTEQNIINIEKKQVRGVGGLLGLENEELVIYRARSVVLASGGCSRVYSHTSNPPVTTGDGVAAAYQLGAEIMDMEFVQFHPTTFYNPSGESFLISESIRGEGAVLRNTNGKRFMPGYHHLADLAPRDIVARSIVNEAKKDGKSYVYLDVTEMKDEYIEKRFPTIFKTLLNYGLDMRKEYIPVVPAAHYLMGGIKTDTYGHTSIKGLYACGEVACTGVHGANRLASNSLLEGLVFGHRIYGSIKGQIEDGEYFGNTIEIDEKYLTKILKLHSEKDDFKNYNNESLLIDTRNEFRSLMTEKAGIERNSNDLKELIKWIEGKLSDLEERNLFLKKCELENMLFNGLLIAKSALARVESRGGHYRSDYPQTKKEWSKKHMVFDIFNSGGKEYVLE